MLPALTAPWNKLRQVVGKIPDKVREAVCKAGKSIIGGLVPGGLPAIELTKAVYDWVTGAGSKQQPRASSSDIDRARAIICVLTEKLDDLAVAVAGMPKDKQEQGEGLIRWRIINDSDMAEVMRELEEEVRSFDVVNTHYRSILTHQGYSGQQLEILLKLALRMIGMSELVPELEAAKRDTHHTDNSFGDATYYSVIQSFQAGAVAISQGKFPTAQEMFKQASIDAPRSAIAKAALATAVVVSHPPKSDTGDVVRRINASLPPPLPIGEGSIRIHIPIRDEDVPITFPNGWAAGDVILWDAGNLSDRGIQILCEILPGLKRLSIRKARQITNASVPHLCKLPLLQNLLLWNSKLTQAGVQELQRSRNWIGLNLR